MLSAVGLAPCRFGCCQDVFAIDPFELGRAPGVSSRGTQGNKDGIRSDISQLAALLANNRLVCQLFKIDRVLGQLRMSLTSRSACKGVDSCVCIGGEKLFQHLLADRTGRTDTESAALVWEQMGHIPLLGSHQCNHDCWEREKSRF